MRVIEIVSYSAGLAGLHLECEVKQGQLQGTDNTTITFPLSEMTSLLNGVSLALTAREQMNKHGVHVTDRPVCPYCGSNQFRDRQLLVTNAECIKCGCQFKFSLGANGPQGEKP